MLVFTRRPLVFKVGLGAMVVSLILFTAGFGGSEWSTWHVHMSGGDNTLDSPSFNLDVIGHNGLWTSCCKVAEFPYTECEPVSKHVHVADWMQVVRVFQVFTLIGFLLSASYALVVNFIRRHPDINNRHLEIALIATGGTGFTASLVYAVGMNSSSLPLMVEAFMGREEAAKLKVYNSTLVDNDLGWAFATDLLGSMLAIAAAVLICSANTLAPLDQPADVTFSAAASSPEGSVVIRQTSRPVVSSFSPDLSPAGSSNI